MCLCHLFKQLIIAPIVQTATSALHVSHSEFYCRQISQLCTCIQIKLSYNQTDLTNHIHNAPTVPISTSVMLAYILTDCSRGTGEGQGEEEEKEEDTEEGQEVETASGRPSRANWHLWAWTFNQQVIDFVTSTGATADLG